VDRPIEIAKRVQIPLKIAAKVDRVDKKYFKSTIEPLLCHSLVEVVGEISDREKDESPGKRLCSANAYRLARAIWAGDD
jgi:hypothetical protein